MSSSKNFKAENGSNKAVIANIKDLINKFNGNPDSPKPSTQHTTNYRTSDKCRSSETESRRSIQRECLTNDLNDVTTIVQEIETTVDLEGVEEHEAKARELREKAQATLEQNEMEFVQAEEAQASARIASEEANAKTQEALEHQELGQELLVEAGATLIEAGAKLQQEAISNQKEVPYNVHQEGEIRQTTCVSTAGVEAAVSAHDFQTFCEVEHFPATAD